MKEIKAMLKYLILKDMIKELTIQRIRTGCHILESSDKEKIKMKKLYGDELKYHERLNKALPDIEKILFGDKK